MSKDSLPPKRAYGKFTWDLALKEEKVQKSMQKEVKYGCLEILNQGQ
jgi:hypothetical protein